MENMNMESVTMETVLGVIVVALAGLTMGSSAWPMKLMRKFQFEHWWFVGMLFGLIIMAYKQYAQVNIVERFSHTTTRSFP
jgi:hypothetical protein